MPIDDRGYFKQYPAPMYEAMCREAPDTLINSTLPYYGPMLYWLCRAVGAINVLEIGMAYGYSSGFMAHAVKDNGTRYQCKGMYYGVDIDNKPNIIEMFKKQNLPIKFYHMDSKDITPATFDGVQFELVFQDAWHSTEYIENEVEVIYPMLKGNGDGYLVQHDVYGYGEEGFKKVANDPAYKWEYIRFLANYGLAILRKMEGYDYDKIYWPEGDQKAPPGSIL